MSNSDIREPKQKRSIEKKNRIIEAGQKLFYEKGYHNTNTAEIAKEAGVSTGIVYNYFNDKKDIFLEVVRRYSGSIMMPLYDKIATIREIQDMSMLLDQFVDILIKSHNLSKSAHEEMLSMSHSDEDVREFFTRFDIDTTNRFVEILSNMGIRPTNPREKVHIAIAMIENLCHEIVYHQHENMNYELMKKEVINAVVNMMSS